MDAATCNPCTMSRSAEVLMIRSCGIPAMNRPAGGRSRQDWKAGERQTRTGLPIRNDAIGGTFSPGESLGKVARLVPKVLSGVSFSNQRVGGNAFHPRLHRYVSIQNESPRNTRTTRKPEGGRFDPNTPRKSHHSVNVRDRSLPPANHFLSCV